MKRLIFIIAALFATAQAQTIQTIGAPTTTVVSRGNFRTDSIFYLPKRQKLPTDSGAVRYQISDSSVYYWTGFQWRRLGVHIDTAAMLLPYLRAADTTAMLSPYLKESDTVWLSNRINLKVNIADTSSMLGNYIRGSGTANYFPKFDASRSVINSKLYESGTNLLFNTTVPSFTSAGIATIENNATSSAVYTYKIADTIRAYMGYGGSNTFDINNLKDGDIRFYTSATLRGRFQTDGTFRLNSLTGTGTRSVVADANGVLSASSTPTDLIDTTYISTRAWRQKGLDSLAALEISGSGTAGQVAYFDGTRSITGENALFYDATNDRLGINTSSPAYRLDVNGSFRSYHAGGIVRYEPETISGSLTSHFNLRAYTTYNNQLSFTEIGVADRWSVGTRTGDDKLYFSQGATVGGSVRMMLNTSAELLLNTTTDAGDYKLQVSGNIYGSAQAVFADALQAKSAVFTGNFNNSVIGWFDQNSTTTDQSFGVLIDAGTTSGDYALRIRNAAASSDMFHVRGNGNVGVGLAAPLNKFTVSTASDETVSLTDVSGYGSLVYRHRTTNAYRDGLIDGGNVYINSESNGELRLNTKTDAGDYKLQVSGNAYVSSSGVFAVSSGGISLGTTTTATKTFRIVNRGTISFENAGGSAGGYLASVNDFDTQLGNNNATLLMERVSGNFTFNSASSGEILMGYASDQGAYRLQVSGNVLSSGTYTSAAPTDGTAAPWKLGSYVTTAPTATGYVQVEINGVKYKLLAATY